MISNFPLVCMWASVYKEYLDSQQYKKKFKLQMPGVIPNRNFHIVLYDKRYSENYYKETVILLNSLKESGK